MATTFPTYRDQTTHEAAVVDCSYNADEITQILKAQALKLKYIISTHGHSDHKQATANSSEPSATPRQLRINYRHSK
jgi:glyoxylase-like metal-dependent hydrolase (beta-lactamase superfamily II)